MSAQADKDQPPPEARLRAKVLRPRDAATLVIVDQALAKPRLLMGRRRMDQVFLPGHYVFPGGRVDQADRFVAAASPLPAATIADLMQGMRGRSSTRRATALAMAAVRETFEETGYTLGQLCAGGAEATAIYPAAWRTFIGCGVAPDLGQLVYFARALTPPGRPRRYDTRFFAVKREAVSGPYTAGDGELEDLGWRTIDEVRGLTLPSITRLVLEDVVALLSPVSKANCGDGGLRGGIGAERIEVPFYFQRRGVFQRALLSRLP